MEIWLVLSASTFGQYSLPVLLVSSLGEPLFFHLVKTVYQKNVSLIGPAIVEIWLILSASTLGQYYWSVLLVSTLGESLHLSI